MSLSVLVLGTDYLRSSIETRSKFSFTDNQKILFSNIITDLGCHETVILSTCNRVEIYVYAENDFLSTLTEQFYAFFSAEETCDFYTYSGDKAIHHLFCVAAGLESAIVGEDQILGQVRSAHEFAAASGFSGKILNKLFREAITTAKEIKTSLSISEYPISAPYIGIKMLIKELSSLEDKTIMVIGTGEMGQLAVKYLEYENTEKILWCTRASSSVKPLSDNTVMISFSERYSYLDEADGIISATASPHSIFTADRFPERNRKLCIVDLAVPQDVEPAVSSIPNVTLYNIDMLNGFSSENLAIRRQLSEQARGIIETKTEDLVSWIFHSRVDTTVGSLLSRCEEITKDTENYLYNKLTLSDHDKKLITKMIESSMHRILREPILKLKELDSLGKQDEYLHLIRELFDLDENY